MSHGFEKIGKVIEETKLGKHLLYKITTNWELIFGNILAKICTPVKIKEDILFISVKNHSWIQELVFSKSLIIKNMNKYKIKIKDIKFVCQEKETLNIEHQKKVKVLNQAEQYFIKDVAYPLKDADLKNSFQNMLKAYIENINKL